MNGEHGTDDEQARRWNGPAARVWVEEQALLDRMLAPFEALLVEAVRAAAPARVLDVGCGTGGTTVAIARHVGAAGECLGVDISEPMLAAARIRAEREGVPARFVRADAAVHPFAPAHFDMIVSRFGVMFFADPVRAFANLRRAAQPGGELRFVAWRSAAENPFMTAAERAAAPLLPELPARSSDGPGQFAFGDRQRVRAILEESGWSGIDIRPLDVACSLPADALDRYVARMGPVGLFLQEADEPTRAKVVEAVRIAFDPYVHGGEVRFTAACWMVGARAPA